MANDQTTTAPARLGLAVGSKSLRERIELELIASLFMTVSQPLMMSGLFALAASHICLTYPDPALRWLAAAGMIASGVRLTFAFRSRDEATSAALKLPRARQLEQRFAFSFVACALILGLFGARSFMLAAPQVHMLMICLLVGYAAGVAAGAGLRPWIAIPSMVLAVVPTATICMFKGDSIYIVTAALLATFLGGGSHSLLIRHATMRRELGQKITFAGLARTDPLTALPNRLALREWFDANVVAAHEQATLAVHCLDLDGFKPVNDRLGHPAGDELLRAVAMRLGRILRKGDIAARLGGDEFAVVQSSPTCSEEAELLAQRISAALGAPYQLGDQVVRISACVGFVTSTGSYEDLDQLLSLADEALYQAKRRQGTVVRFDRERRRKPSLVA